MRPAFRTLAALAWGLVLTATPGCTVGPKYHPPSAADSLPVPGALPGSFKELGGFKPAQPNDGAIHGDWWKLFKESELDQLEDQLNHSNQSIAVSMANFDQARALVGQARAQYFPTVSLAPTAAVQGVQSATSNTVASSTATGPYSLYAVPVQASWGPDLWGKVRNTVKGREASAQVASADLDNVRLTQQAELASDFYQIRAQDAQIELLEDTVKAYQEMLELTQSLSKTGIDSDEPVAQAETQLETAQAQLTNLGILRAQYEHAIALLTGQAASGFSLARAPLKTTPPAVPIGVPSQLLERRPDVAEAERGMAAANAQIGVAVSAYYPQLTLTGGAGIGSNSFRGLTAVPAFVWSVGATLAETLFDGGLRSTTLDQARAAYTQSVASYRLAVLTAFQQVEDSLASVLILGKELGQQDAAVQSATRYVKIARRRFQLGLDPYLNVVTAQLTLLQSRQAALTLRMQQLTSTVSLIEALGGGWDRSRI